MPLPLPQCKKCRRAGEKLFLKGEKCFSAKCPLIKRNFPPGVHGSKKAGRMTNYGQQLKEKQKAKRIYGLREQQFKNYFVKSFQKTGNTSEWLFRFLESRLDNTIYRLGLASSRTKARQLVSHGHFTVNGKKVNIPSFGVKTGDEIKIKENKAKKKVFSDLEETLKSKKEAAPWLSLDGLTGKVTSLPKLGDLDAGIDWQTIIEFYSK